MMHHLMHKHVRQPVFFLHYHNIITSKEDVIDYGMIFANLMA